MCVFFNREILCLVVFVLGVLIVEFVFLIVDVVLVGYLGMMLFVGFGIVGVVL